MSVPVFPCQGLGRTTGYEALVGREERSYTGRVIVSILVVRGPGSSHSSDLGGGIPLANERGVLLSTWSIHIFPSSLRALVTADMKSISMKG